MLATFNGTWDWTAVGTLALAIVTGVSLAFGWRSLKQSQREIELSRSEVEEAHRPVVVPLADQREVIVGLERNQEARPIFLTSHQLSIPLENVGTGPALNVAIYISGLDGPSEMWLDAGWLTALAAGRRVAVVVEVKPVAATGSRLLTSS